MGRASTLSLHERHQIKALSTTGYTVKQIDDVAINRRGSYTDYLVNYDYAICCNS
uniref:Helix-turn-helix domain-containing protein n=1 Tax=Heterorhabditis bacteriophora TaxID=37862 RepID=A0A1I7X872_HETBA